jgi:hypothetical protein
MTLTSSWFQFCEVQLQDVVEQHLDDAVQDQGQRMRSWTGSDGSASVVGVATGRPQPPTSSVSVKAVPIAVRNELTCRLLLLWSGSTIVLVFGVQGKEELASTLSERIKAKLTVLEFVSQYVDLKPTASGDIGLCPFHDDHHPSFGVNEEGNYCHCFAGCSGGAVIDSWMKWRKCDFTTAVRELAGMVL